MYIKIRVQQIEIRKENAISEIHWKLVLKFTTTLVLKKTVDYQFIKSFGS